MTTGDAISYVVAATTIPINVIVIWICGVRNEFAWDDAFVCLAQCMGLAISAVQLSKAFV